MMKQLKAIPVRIAQHHTKCQTANKTMKDQLHEAYLKYIEPGSGEPSGPIMKMKPKFYLEELIHMPNPESPKFRRYTENG